MSTPTSPVGVGLIGAGVISDTYLENLTSFPDLKVLFVADLDEPRAKAQAEKHGVPAGGSVDELLAHPDIELVVNLTIPVVHVEVGLRVIAAGKHLWSEKPISLDRESGAQLLDAAEAAGVRVGCAPDTFLGAGLQTAFRIIARGDIGTPLTALALFQSPGPESWHPNPAFLFQEGAGPMFDVGVYYLTALAHTLGPFARVAGLGSTSRASRVIGSGPKAGESFDVTVPSHVGALLQFESGQSGQAVFSFDSKLRRTGVVEIAGTEGTIVFPDPNNFDGDILVYGAGEEPTVIPAVGHTSTRGTGALEMAQAIREGRPHRASGASALHVLDTMVSIAESVESGSFVEVASSFEPSPALPEDWDPKVATLQ
ncbi:Gfo/Idh/MocA family protein [Planctomonas psychrotolerans]|uniref:Gfo/Idh/MocA family protein n=1 Tax=Planctomonas psychrotolerans TaxID=2528712 RepID=UPI0012397CA6|nr:Gfo/Idh/MocA family oxidoreductase [Planctomonas psychrotolerans]